MIAIEDKLISEDVFSKQFACELSACKGACCWEGDYGAPLKDNELKEIDQIITVLKDYLPVDSYEILLKEGPYSYNKEIGSHVTSLKKDGACVFMLKDELGIAHCGIEKSYRDGRHDFRKPISCHLYPIRVIEKEELGFTAINYDKWSICSPACKNGKKNGISVFRFVKDALIRKFGEEFYNEMEAVAKQLELE
ncbi:MAG: DUF3109 family protein [Saprospiraceae bacterium]